MKATLSTKCFEEYLERLAAAGEDVDARAGEALLAGGQVAQAGMQRRVAIRTHNLQEHIVVAGPKADGNYVYVQIGLIGADANTARYGNAQEFGTSSMAAHPYVRPTMIEDKSAIRAAMLDALKAGRVL
jgi:HK97 gp10 family phage protein